MIIIQAYATDDNSLNDTCHQAINLANQLDVIIELTYRNQVISARPNAHPYNLIQEWNRKANPVE